MSAETQRLAEGLAESTRQQAVQRGLPSGGRVFLKLFLHSVAMFSLPFMAYYTCKNYVEKEFGVEPPKSFIYGAVAAVCVIQAIIFSYLYQAFKEERLEKRLKAAAKKD